jgi:predicted pyridoxine 5'-phosphate oxidase superfamily flavin-nucleotide-binding protein
LESLPASLILGCMGEGIDSDRDTGSAWHAGEVSLQRLAGSAEQLARHGHRILRSTLSEQHRNFYPRLPFVVLGAVDPGGAVWATLRAGQPGFLSSPDTTRLHVVTERDPGDPAETGLGNGDAAALLGIELHTRRRNRLNGKVARNDDHSFDVVVGQAYGNCPQYIQLRDFEFSRDPTTPSPTGAKHLDHLDARARAMIATADTFFVASYVDLENGKRQVDVSHRGGRPGFVRVGTDEVLTIPDFAGNQFFNTLGNFLLNPRAGLVFVDFETGDLLQLSGTAQVVLDDPQIATFAGAERLWRFTPRQIVYRAEALPLHWTFEQDGWSPESLRTGSWPEPGLPRSAASGPAARAESP